MPGHQLIPTGLKYSKQRKIYKHMSYSVSVRHSVISYTIDVNRRQTNNAHLQNDDVTLSHSAMQTNSACTDQHHPGAFWDKLGYTAAYGYTENNMTWYNIRIRNGLLKWREKRNISTITQISSLPHVPQRAVTEPELVRCWYSETCL